MRCKPLAFGLTMLVMLGGMSCSNDSQKPATADSSAASPRPAPQAPRSPSRPQNIEILTVLSVEHSVEVLAQLDGMVTEVDHDQNSWVEEGALLARIDDRELQAKLDHAREDLEVAKNNLKYQEAATKAKDAAYQRQLELRKFGLSSKAAEEEAEFLSKGAHFDVDSYMSSVKEKEAEIRGIQVQVDKTRIVAPFAGYVTQRSIRVGQGLVKNDPCFRVSQLSPLQVRFLVPESSGKAPQVGDHLRVIPVGDNTREYEARVKRLSPTIDPASMSYDVTAELTGPKLDSLRPGMAVKVMWPARDQPAAP